MLFISPFHKFQIFPLIFVNLFCFDFSITNLFLISIFLFFSFVIASNYFNKPSSSSNSGEKESTNPEDKNKDAGSGTSNPEIKQSPKKKPKTAGSNSESPVEDSTIEQPTVSGDEPASREAEGSESGTRTQISVEEQREINRLRIERDRVISDILDMRNDIGRLRSNNNRLHQEIRDLQNGIENRERGIRNLSQKPKGPKQ